MTKKTEENKFKSLVGKKSEMEIAFNQHEQTVFESAMDPVSQLQPFNSDPFYQRDGDYREYEGMLLDDQISVCSNLKKDLVLGGGWEISVKEDSQQEIKDDLDRLLREGLKVTLTEQLREILTAYDFGFSLTEKIFKRTEDGKVTLKELKTRNPVTWRLHQNELGDVTTYEQTGRHKTANIPENALIHYVNNRRFSNPYGVSDLLAASTAYFIKKNIVRYLAIFLEKSASPIPIAKYTSGIPNEAVDELFSILKSFQNKTSMVIPKEFEIEFLESKSNGEAYHKAINLMNMFISRSMFIPDLAGFGGSETDGGSYSLGEHQLNIFFNHINQRRCALEDIINQQIITPMVINNYGVMDSYPKFKFLPVDDSEATELAKVWLDAVKGRVWKPTEDEVNHFLKLTKFPESDEIEFHEEKEQDGQEEPNDDKEKDDKDKKPEDPTKEADDDKKEEFALGGNKKVNIKLLKSAMMSSELSIVDESEALFENIITDYLSKIVSKKILEKEDLEGLGKIKLKKSARLRQVLTRNMKEAFRTGSRIAKTEIRSDFSVSEDFDEKFLAFLDQENLSFIGDWEYNFQKKTRALIIEGIKDGRPISAVLGEIKKETKALTDTSIERYSRTKITEVMNKGRAAVFDSSDVVQGYQYSAILDSRTTRICNGLHDKQFKKGTEPIPPMHFNCRSLLIPVLINDDLDPVKKIGTQGVNKFINDNKGKGFSKR